MWPFFVAEKHFTIVIFKRGSIYTILMDLRIYHFNNELANITCHTKKSTEEKDFTDGSMRLPCFFPEISKHEHTPFSKREKGS